jgi:hypothetical protein
MGSAYLRSTYCSSGESLPLRSFWRTSLSGSSPRGEALARCNSLRDLLVPVLENPREPDELHWTGVKLHGWLKEHLGVEIGFSTTLRYLHELGYDLRVPRPWPERQNEKARRAF